MHYEEFARRVEHNTSILKTALDNNVNLINIADKLYTWTTEPGELSFSVLMRNLHDIIPAAVLGALSNTSPNGADAYTVDETGVINVIEIKTAEIRSSKIWKGSKGGLNLGISDKKNSRRALTSAMQAKYKLHTHDNLLSKNMKTVLFIVDSDNVYSPNSYIDAWEMKGEHVIEYLTRTNCRDRNIKLCSFMKIGHQTKTTVNLLGFENFKKMLEDTVPSKKDWLENNGYS